MSIDDRMAPGRQQPQPRTPTSWVHARPGLFDALVVAVCIGAVVAALVALMQGEAGIAAAPVVSAVLLALLALRREQPGGSGTTSVDADDR